MSFDYPSKLSEHMNYLNYTNYVDMNHVKFCQCYILTLRDVLWSTKWIFFLKKSISRGYVFCVLKYCLHFVIWAIRGLLNNHRIMFISVSIGFILENSKSIKQWFLNVFMDFLLFLGHIPDIEFLHNVGKFYPQQGNDF